jgi:hypothetical protein
MWQMVFGFAVIAVACGVSVWCQVIAECGRAVDRLYEGGDL